MNKRFSLLMTLVFCIHFLHAQQVAVSTARLHYSIQAGVNFQTIYGQDQYGTALNDELILKYHIGVNAEIPLISKLYLQSGLLFTLKGSKIKVDSIETKTPNVSYLELPLNIIYKSKSGNGQILFGLGPYLAIGLGGTTKYEESTTSHNSDIKFKNSIEANAPLHIDFFRPLDFGANILAGYELANKLSFQLNLQLGFTKINPTDERIFNDKTSYKNIGFGISVGYGF